MAKFLGLFGANRVQAAGFSTYLLVTGELEFPNVCLKLDHRGACTKGLSTQGRTAQEAAAEQLYVFAILKTHTMKIL
ncbi:hypothetical protein GN956_G5397 [Arapaima gigas]